MSVDRTDERTMESEPHHGCIIDEMDKLFRSASLPMEIGQRVELSGMTVTVLSLTEDGRPQKAAFRFSMPLEDSSLMLLQWGANGYVPFSVQGIGASHYIAGQRGFF